MRHKAFSVVELLVTIVIATIFLTASYQLYSTILTDSGDTRKESAASNLAYDYLRRYSAFVSGNCSPNNFTFPNIPISEGSGDLGLATVNVVISCPLGTTTTTTQTVAGNYNLTIPSGITSMTVEAWGAGGGGSSGYYGNKGGAGGGGGEYRSSSLTVTPGATYSYTVGAGGNGGAGGGTNSGTNGTDTTFNTTTIIAKAGTAGTTSVAGSGGSGGTGVTGYSGGNGFLVGSGVNSGGGGGSSAGSLLAGVAATSTTGATAPANGGNGGTGGTGAPTPTAGSIGNNPGGGGGGGANWTSPPASSAGGKGADGKITLTYNTSDVFKIVVSVTYNNPTNTVTYATYKQI